MLPTSGRWQVQEEGPCLSKQYIARSSAFIDRGEFEAAQADPEVIAVQKAALSKHPTAAAAVHEHEIERLVNALRPFVAASRPRPHEWTATFSMPQHDVDAAAKLVERYDKARAAIL